MAGVAGPMLAGARRARAGARFLAGLTVGSAAGGLVLALAVYLLGRLAGTLPAPVRWAVLAAACVALAGADLAGRTPHPWRQVPQSLVRTLPPGTLGLTWGFDLGLLVTTQKTTSLVWVGLVAVALLHPGYAVAVVVGMATVAALAVVVASVVLRGRPAADPRWRRTWTRHARFGSAVAILAVLAASVALGFPT